MAMADWTQSGRVVGARTSAKWVVKRSPGAAAAPAPMTRRDMKAAAKQARIAVAHERGEPCGRGDCLIVICREARVIAKKEQAELKAQLQQDRHANGEPCGQRGCQLDLCRASAKAAKTKGQQGAAAVRPSKEAVVAARRKELHAKMLDCGEPRCTNPECVRLRAAKKTKRKPGFTNTVSVSAPVKTKPKRKPSPATASAPVRASASALKQVTPAQRPGATKPVAAPAKSRPIKNPSTKVCRECLRSKPISAFPNPKVRRCEDCGGRPASRSVRTVQGGAPGLGKHR